MQRLIEYEKMKILQMNTGAIIFDNHTIKGRTSININ